MERLRDADIKEKVLIEGPHYNEYYIIEDNMSDDELEECLRISSLFASRRGEDSSPSPSDDKEGGTHEMGKS